MGEARAELGIAVAQFAPGGDSAANLGTIRALARKAADRGAGLIVFPEYSSFFTEPVGRQFVDAAEPLDGPFAVALMEVAASLGVHIVAGLVEQADGSRFSNTLVALAPTGELTATYRKQHLYDAFGASESDWVVAGALENPQTFRIGDLTIGMQTCYDLRFPEVTRRLADAGADLVLVPAEWVRGPLKEHHWRTLLTARALENTLYVAGADHAPPSGVGRSMIVDPSGVELASLGDEEDVALAWASAGRLASVRRINPSLALRRYRVVPR